MSLFDEKRNKSDRRTCDYGPPPGVRERRIRKDRRQTSISEISFHEWTLHLLNFKKRIAARAARRAAAKELKQKKGGETLKQLYGFCIIGCLTMLESAFVSLSWMKTLGSS